MWYVNQGNSQEVAKKLLTGHDTMVSLKDMGCNYETSGMNGVPDFVEKMLQNKKGKRSDSLVMLRVNSLEVELITAVLQEFYIRVNKDVCPFSEAMVDDVWDIPH